MMERAQTIRPSPPRRARTCPAGGGAPPRGRQRRGTVMLDYVMVLAVLVPLVAYTFTKLLTLVADYFGMIAFWASWPFL